MSTVAVRRLDPRDDAQWAGYHRVTAESQLHERPFADIGDAQSFRVSFLREDESALVLGWTAILDDEVVGAALAVLPKADNTHLAWTEVNVAPALRRRGVGTALLAAMGEELAARGRRTDQAEVARSYEPQAGEVAGAAFARAHGYACAHTEVHYVVRSPLPGPLLDSLAAEADRYASGYRIVSWRDRCPDEWVAAVCALEEAFIREAPTGDLDIEPEVWSEQRLRENEERRLERGRHAVASIAVAPDGSLAGNTELVISTRELRMGVFQSGTLVLPAHRGHRLGLALKVANHRLLQQVEPAPRLVHTYNAPENAPMIGVNSRLGFEPVELNDEWQRRRD